MAWSTARPINKLISCLSCASLVETVARNTATGTRRTSSADSVAPGRKIDMGDGRVFSSKGTTMGEPLGRLYPALRHLGDLLESRPFARMEPCPELSSSHCLALAGSEYILRKTGAGSLLVYGISSGALKAALFAQRHPDRVARLALDAFVWTGEGSPTLAERRKKLPQFQSMNRRPIDRAFVRSIFTRDHPGTADDATIEAFADAILALDDSVPTGTYVDMCAKLPLVEPEKIPVPTIVMRGEYDGIAGFDDLVAFWKRLPNADKTFTVMAGISHASFQQKNYRMVYHILHAFFSQPAPVYRA